MRLGGRLAGAIEVLTDIEERRRPVADALKDWGLSHRFAGSGDRAAIGNIVYDALRMKLSHGWMMDDNGPLTLGYAVMFRQWGYNPGTLAAELDGDRFAPAPLPQANVEAFSSRDIVDAPAHIQGDIPEWLVSSFEQNFGDQWIAEAQALNLRPSLDLRVNTLKADEAKVLKALERSGAQPAPLARNGIRIPPGECGARLPNVTAELGFQKGWFEVQDEGSQIVAEMVSAHEGEQVLDYCAGGGGKTLALAAQMVNKGQIHAYDADRRRLAPIIERLKRAGTRNVQVHDSEDGLANLHQRCDRVLIDAPCTGTGTWRRRPDTKWRLSEKNIEERVAQQAEVLNNASQYVRIGGKLVYVTCSLLPEENQQQMQRFVEANPSYKLAVASDVFKAVTKVSSLKPHSPDGMTVTLSPAATGTDGFFIAILDRTG
ncbi:RsmB/NOP family class I SAM-dependent RNA methyltransferase [Rhizobium sp. L1K21]|uniref:RsmB/NOP family class I SAM-dependent RNA methyltransferase n=1 Tax=Rhizobium sp. L1K21 TaxID=2954933 RepID=UPI0020921219|nr:RsmB/NOP family class I SAM-dependent RNA methyltransferase [Rhizobium sp. L1K21]MCO6187329.1 RsmB/NOP family class I SAM-dependent RNA methyltransferase [Rhizobium sp. L1K21]